MSQAGRTQYFARRAKRETRGKGKITFLFPWFRAPREKPPSPRLAHKAPVMQANSNLKHLLQQSIARKTNVEILKEKI